ncbi:hypothetical protein SprV_0200558700 [Sparganum proliferum]
MGDKQAMDAGNENAVVRAVVGKGGVRNGHKLIVTQCRKTTCRREGIDAVCGADNGRNDRRTPADRRTASISSSAAEESQATMIGESNQLDVTITDGRRKSGRLGRGKQRRLDKLADEGTGRRCEMIVAVAC